MKSENQQNKVLSERCKICNCKLTKKENEYGKSTVEGRAHRTKHHLVAKRFFGGNNNKHKSRMPIFDICPWNSKEITILVCYECHEHLLHNPVFTTDDIESFADLIKVNGFDENEKPSGSTKVGERIQLLNEVIAAGLEKLTLRNKGLQS